MATLVGPNDLKNVSLPALIDATALRNYALRDGTTFDQIVADVDDALQITHDSVMGSPLANLFYVTEERAVEYRIGTSSGFEDHTEHTGPDAQRGDTTGHMLPLAKKDRKLAWTEDFLENARRPKIDADIAAVAQDYRDMWEKALLTRLFKATADTGKAYDLGSGGSSVPFADGGTADANYVPVPNSSRASAFSSSHTHFLRLNGITQANLETAVDHLWEHGADAPYDLLVAGADVASWENTTNVTGYLPTRQDLVIYGQNVSLANVADYYLGIITTKRGPVRLWASARVPTGYWSVYKTYGPDDARNPLWVVRDPIYPNFVKLVVKNVGKYPLEGAVAVAKFGVGVGDNRVSAVLVYNNSSGSYATPTIS